MLNYTFTLLKPTAVAKGYTGAILHAINEGGFRIRAMKMIRLSKAEAMAFYAVHKDRPFYDSLTDFMSSGPIVAAIVEKENAVECYRKLIGATNPANADEGTIRKQFGTNLEENAVHGSDSDENAVIESTFFFATKERFLDDRKVDMNLKK